MLMIADRVALTTLRAQGYRRRHVATPVGRVHMLERKGRAGWMPPIVVLHGVSAAGVRYAPLLRALAHGTGRVIAPDMPGHGFSDVPVEGLRPDTLEQGLFHALDESLDAPAVLVGNSLGGAAAVRFALRRPEKVAGLMLVSPGGAAMDDAALKDLVGRFKLDSHSDALRFVDELLARRSRLRHAYAWGVRRTMREPQIRSFLGAVSPKDLLTAEQLASLAMPVHLVWGRGDRILPTHSRDFFVTNLPRHAEISEPTHVGHSPHLEDPQGLANVVVDFARSVAAASAARNPSGR
ncbi:MAG: alpha/beta fold hydrolase [Polyangiales bacterium]